MDIWPAFDNKQPLADGRWWIATFDSYDQRCDVCYYFVEILDGDQVINDVIAKLGVDTEPSRELNLASRLRDGIAAVAAEGRSNTEYRGCARKARS